MLRKILFSCLLISSFSYGQFNQDAPWMQNIKTKSNQTSKTETISIDDISKAFNEYWLDKDYKKKGSGYKPYKRWENYWNYFANSNGVIPSSKELYQSWKNKVAGTGKVNEISNWTSIGPVNTSPFSGRLPGQGRVNAIAVDPNNSNIWYVGAPAGGIWKSTNSGSSWVNLFDDFPQIGVSGIAIDPNNSDIIYIATGDDDAADSYSIGVYKSNDGGLTWNETGLNPSNTTINFLANEIVIDPSNSNILWLGTNNGLFKSTDAGNSWEVKQNGDIKDFKLKPGDSNTIYAVSSTQFFKSVNGNTFTTITSALPASSGRLVLGTSPADPSVVYILSANTSINEYKFQGIYKSVDSGNTFTKTSNTVDLMESNQAWFDLALEVSPTNANELYVGCLNIWKSTNGGISFNKRNNWFDNNAAYTHADIHTIKFFGNKLFVGSDGGIYVSENGATTFSDKTSNLEISQFYRISVAQKNSDKIIGGLQDNGGFVLNNNQWNNYHGGDGMDNVIDPNNENLLYGFTQNGGSLNISTDSGQSIGSIGPPQKSDGSNLVGNWITPLAISSTGEVYSGFDAVYKLVGNSWVKSSNNFLARNELIDDLEIDPNNPSIMYAVNFETIYRSLDGGVTFTNIASLDNQISDLAINRTDGNILYVTTSLRVGTANRSQINETDRGVFKITINNDFGSIENITHNLPTDQAFFSIIHQGRHIDNPIYVGTSLGVYRLDDTIDEWEEYYTNFPNVAVGDLEISLEDNIITAATYGRGVWQSPIPVKTAENDLSLISVDINSDAVICSNLDPEILVANKGLNDITTINISYSTTNSPEENYTWNGILTSGQTTTITLPTLSSLNYGKSILNITATIPNDAFADNNSLNKSIFINKTGIGNAINTFDTPEETLIAYTEGSNQIVWEKGIPNGTLLNKASTGEVYATNLDGNHPDQVKAILLSNCYSISSITAPVLKFKMAYDLELNWDIVYVQYSIDSGNSWNILGNINSQPNWYNSNRTNALSGSEDDCQNCPGAQWTGTNTNLTEYSYDFGANALLGETDLTTQSNVIFRIVFHSDAAVNQEGVVIDDFQIEGIEDDEDDDNDGILDENDNCPLTANANQNDNDNDGLGDVCDADDDNDGILDINDNCPLTANADQADNDGDGVGDVCDLDLDNDGVPNNLDLCPSTPANAIVDINGCEIFSLPANNFKILTNSETCISSNNGSISIEAIQSLEYTANLTGNNESLSNNFTTSTSFANIKAGNYTICITVADQPNYENCIDVVISEPTPLGVGSIINSLNKEVTLSLNGAQEYIITLNEKVFRTSENTVTLPLTKIENKLSVQTDKNCQGIYEENIILGTEVYIYPNPIVGGELTIFLGANSPEKALITLYSINGTKQFSKKYTVNNNKILFNVDNLSQGIYLLNVKSGETLSSYKIIRK
ncbi:thrombospondin type 3 repeat-containing protein [Cellulophaga tyrosinoxydans]|uniref:Por secretion system C-terminal sorting domain-containing protein n=1 Tax=Cellulophaga tyrosinoxydans TaxID=504486 RepID=A0A1W1ZES4_9FLAO|nr:thrombospondin type 3 repeat-containing protein [Cellulophaga tyrosinoxydans]SMC46904.1 Por secretion system C-terminal sorting domain-containing protein [Cellulophaga tyrosinoxydans]